MQFRDGIIVGELEGEVCDSGVGRGVLVGIADSGQNVEASSRQSGTIFVPLRLGLADLPLSANSRAR